MLRSKLEVDDGIINSPYLCSYFTKAVPLPGWGNWWMLAQSWGGFLDLDDPQSAPQLTDPVCLGRWLLTDVLLLSCWVSERMGWGMKGRVRLCALEWLAGSCRERASPNPASRPRQCPFDWRPEHVFEMVVCPLGCSFLASAHGDRHFCQTDRLVRTQSWPDLQKVGHCNFLHAIVIPEERDSPSVNFWIGSHAWSTQRLCEHHIPDIQHILMDTESFTGHRQCFCFTNRMQRHGQMAVT